MGCPSTINIAQLSKLKTDASKAINKYLKVSWIHYIKNKIEDSFELKGIYYEEPNPVDIQKCVFKFVYLKFK